MVETLEKDGGTWVLAATAADPKRDMRAVLEMIYDALPSAAPSATRLRAGEEPEEDDFENALDRAFCDDWGDDPLASLSAIVG